MSILIAGSDGHGDFGATPGKRSPRLSNGSVMYENSFNKDVWSRTKKNLERCGFRTLSVAPGDGDTPLSVRCDKANDANADLYLSIHANANTGKFGNWGGIETYCHFDYPESVKMAKIIHRNIIKGSPLQNRGIKNGDWLYEARHTEMNYVLVELGFMDSHHDIDYLLSDKYRQECADELAQAICEIYGYEWIPTSKVQTASQPEKDSADGKLTRGERGRNCQILNEMLNELEYTRKTDDLFDQYTEAALIAFQKAHGLTPNGVYTSEVGKAMVKAIEIKNMEIKENAPEKSDEMYRLAKLIDTANKELIKELMQDGYYVVDTPEEK